MKICQLCNSDFMLHHFFQPLMTALVAEGHEVVGVGADGPLLAKVRAAGLRVEVIPFQRSLNPLAHIAAFRELVRLFRRERFDLVHTHAPIASMVGRWAAWVAGVPRIVYTAHGFYFHERMPGWKRTAHIGLEWLAGRVTHVLFTENQEDAATARALGLCRGGVVEAIGNGADPTRFCPVAKDDPARAALRASLGVAPETPVIVVIGRLVAEKGYPELFQAMTRVEGAVLWVVGDRLPSDHAGSIDAAVAAVRADPGLSRRVQFLGYRADVPEVLGAADIFTLPSHREGMPRSIIEAMLAGLPVVATDIRGSREEVIDGATGFLVPVNDPAALGVALGRLAGDPALRRRLGEGGRARAVDLYDEAKVIARQLTRLGLFRSQPHH